MGEYTNQVTLKRPGHMAGRKEGTDHPDRICVDRCLEDEIKDLWQKGIRTTGCCCGHNIVPGYIGVIDEDIPVMKQMGYKVHFNKSRPDDEDSFQPKTPL